MRHPNTDGRRTARRMLVDDHHALKATLAAFDLHSGPKPDWTALSEVLEDHGHVTVDDFLPAPLAKRLTEHLKQRQDWRWVLNSGEKILELSRAQVSSLDGHAKSQLDDACHLAARTGFQFRYETIRTPDVARERMQSNDPLAALAERFCEGAMREGFSRLLQRQDLSFADMQATAFGPGDFLTGHDDVIKGKQRVAAYVLNLSPIWRLEWGGLLIFHDANGTGRCFSPRFNRLHVFKVGQLHSVSEVTRAAPLRRYSLTGWFRLDAEQNAAPAPT